MRMTRDTVGLAVGVVSPVEVDADDKEQDVSSCHHSTQSERLDILRGTGSGAGAGVWSCGIEKQHALLY